MHMEVGGILNYQSHPPKCFSTLSSGVLFCCIDEELFIESDYLVSNQDKQYMSAQALIPAFSECFMIGM